MRITVQTLLRTVKLTIAKSQNLENLKSNKAITIQMNANEMRILFFSAMVDSGCVIKRIFRVKDAGKRLEAKVSAKRLLVELEKLADESAIGVQVSKKGTLILTTLNLTITIPSILPSKRPKKPANILSFGDRK